MGRDTLYGYLAEHREQLFRDEGFAALYCPDNGRVSVPPSLAVSMLLLRAYEGVNFVEAAGRNLRRRGIDPASCPQAFGYDAERNTCTCPAGKELVPRGTKKDRVGVLRHVYQAQASHCQGCAFKKKCCPGEIVKRRTIIRSENVRVVVPFCGMAKQIARTPVVGVRGSS
ncbi:MAG: hypothetical protein ABSH01_07820 [Terriglobia bacterium]